MNWKKDTIRNSKIYLLQSTILWRRIKEIENFRIESELDSGKTTSTSETYSISKGDNDLVKVVGPSNLRVLFP
jgi:hypothetical protein